GGVPEALPRGEGGRYRGGGTAGAVWGGRGLRTRGGGALRDVRLPGGAVRPAGRAARLAGSGGRSAGMGPGARLGFRKAMLRVAELLRHAAGAPDVVSVKKPRKVKDRATRAEALQRRV